MKPDTTIKAYRIKGGAIVRVTRNGRTRRYRVGCKRFRALSERFNGRIPGHWSGYFGRSTLDLTRWVA